MTAQQRPPSLPHRVSWRDHMGTKGRLRSTPSPVHCHPVLPVMDVNHPPVVPPSFRGRSFHKSMSLKLRQLCGMRLEQKLKVFKSMNTASSVSKGGSPLLERLKTSTNGADISLYQPEKGEVLGRSCRASPRRTPRRLSHVKDPSSERLEFKDKEAELQQLRDQQRELQTRIDQLSKEVSDSSRVTQVEAALKADKLPIFGGGFNGTTQINRYQRAGCSLKTIKSERESSEAAEGEVAASDKAAVVTSFERALHERRMNAEKKSKTLHELLAKSKEAYTQRSVTSLRSILSDRSTGEEVSRSAAAQRARVWFKSRTRSTSESSSSSSLPPTQRSRTDSTSSSSSSSSPTPRPRGEAKSMSDSIPPTQRSRSGSMSSSSSSSSPTPRPRREAKSMSDSLPPSQRSRSESESSSDTLPPTQRSRIESESSSDTLPPIQRSRSESESSESEKLQMSRAVSRMVGARSLERSPPPIGDCRSSVTDDTESDSFVVKEEFSPQTQASTLAKERSHSSDDGDFVSEAIGENQNAVDFRSRKSSTGSSTSEASRHTQSSTREVNQFTSKRQADDPYNDTRKADTSGISSDLEEDGRRKSNSLRRCSQDSGSERSAARPSENSDSDW